MAASLATGSALLQPTKFSVTRSSSKLSSSSSHVSRAFGFEPATSARVSCSLQSYVKEFAEKCSSATKIAAFTLAASSLVASGASAEGPPKRLTYDEIQSQTYLDRNVNLNLNKDCY